MAISLASLKRTTALAAPLHAEETVDSGAYLAARIAESENDFRAAATWYGKAILSDNSVDHALLALGIHRLAEEQVADDHRDRAIDQPPTG